MSIYLSTASVGDGLDIKELASVVLNAAEENEGDLGIIFDRIDNVARPEISLARPWGKCDKSDFWVVSMQFQLRSYRVLQAHKEF